MFKIVNNGFIIKVGHGLFEVFCQQGFALNEVEIRIQQYPVIQIMAKISN